MRDLTAVIAAPVLKVSGFRFSKAWRTNEFGFKAFCFKYLICTTKANLIAGMN